MFVRHVLRAALASSIGLAALALATTPSGANQAVTVDQGPNWTPATRAQFYSQSQGSQLMPLAWFLALKQSNGQPFLGEHLNRYGYLPNPASPTPGLPIGFTVNGAGDGTMLGFTCAACHTRQIVAGGITYRIDGGPAIVDIHSFLEDLDAAAGTVVKGGAAFRAFADTVLGLTAPPAPRAELKNALQAWYLRFDTLIKRTLPAASWGPGRYDIVSSIFNQLGGLDLGPPPSHLITGNMQPAAAPVRYPFLWNASTQDRTQWPGFAQNGNKILALERNLGELFGSFANFVPQKTSQGIDYLAVNSADFAGLFALEELIKKIGPPKWPWTVNRALAAQGAAVFNRPQGNGGCVDCHGIAPGITRPIDQKTWATPVLDDGTDSREYAILARTSSTGLLEGAALKGDPHPLPAVAPAIDVLDIAVLGSVEQYCAKHALECTGADGTRLAGSAPSSLARPQGSAPAYAYEARVLQGIWAAAPYLHNGSVQSLAQLLTPPALRASSFKVGANYDRATVGLATEQTQFKHVFKATGCDARNSGDSNCGHDFGTRLSATNKTALLEYLKTL